LTNTTAPVEGPDTSVVFTQMAVPPPNAYDVEPQFSPDASVATTLRATALPGGASCGVPGRTTPVWFPSRRVTETLLAVDATEPRRYFEAA
jgi:hypothetical protein